MCYVWLVCRAEYYNICDACSVRLKKMVILQFEGHSFIPIFKNTQTEFLIHQFCGEALKPRPNTGKSLLIHFYNFFLKMFFYLVSVNLTSNCKVSMHNCSKHLNSSFIKQQYFMKNPFLQPFQRTSHGFQVRLRYSSLSGS